MKRISYIMICFFCFLSLICKSQIYFGKNSFGKMEFVNDSVVFLDFIDNNGVIFHSKAYYCNSHDTVFLSTEIKQHFEVIFSEDEIPINPGGRPILTKKYSKLNGKITFMNEDCFGYYDPITKDYVFNNFGVENGDILVIRFGIFYERLEITTQKESEKYFIIKDYGNLDNVIFLNDFPLLRKGNCLIPINAYLNEKCWIDNGFFFPKMKKSKKNRDYQTLAIWTLGLRDLPCW